MKRPPGVRAGISKDDVLGAALVLLREGGLSSVSMRRVAEAVGVAPNALYSYFPDKAALVDALMDEVLGGVDEPTRGGWRSRIESILSDTRRVLLAHPDLVALFLARQTTGPNAMRLGEAMLGALDRGGIRGARAVLALQALLVHTIGASAFEIPRRDDPDPERRRRRGEAATRALSAREFPHMTALGEEIARYPGDAVFRLGLESLLDGLAVGAFDDQR